MNRLPTGFRTALCLALAAAAVCAQDDGTAARTFWLPSRDTADPFPAEIDRLFNLILWVTSVTMVGVFAVLAFFLVKYRAKPDRKAFYTHGNHKAELIWTIGPALILLWLALIQANTWLDIKAPSRMPRPHEATHVRVFAQQFAWNFRQAGADGRFERFNEERFDEALAAWRVKAKAEAAKYLEGEPHRLDLPWEEKDEDGGPRPLVRPNALSEEFWTKDDDDDVVSAGTLVVPNDKPVLLDLRSVDVLHSFWIPHLRVKQDAVPGKPTPVWFHPTKEGTFEIACAELCGNLHTTMAAKLRVVSREEYDKYVADESAKQAGKANRSAAANNDNVWRAWGAQDQNVIAAQLR